jgi:hypothetical protein
VAKELVALNSPPVTSRTGLPVGVVRGAPRFKTFATSTLPVPLTVRKESLRLRVEPATSSRKFPLAVRLPVPTGNRVPLEGPVTVLAM